MSVRLMSFQLMSGGCLALAMILAGGAGLAADKPAPVETAARKKAPAMIYELRTYTTHPGKLPDLHKRFRDHTVKLFEKHGMVNVIYWVPVDQPETLIYILAHQSRDAAKKSFDSFRKDPEWQRVFKESHKNGEIVKEVKSVFLETVDYSPVQWDDLKKSLPKAQPVKE